MEAKYRVMPDQERHTPAPENIMAHENGSNVKKTNQDIPIEFPDNQSGFQTKVDSYSHGSADKSGNLISNKKQSMTSQSQDSNHQTKHEQNYNEWADEKSLMTASQKGKTIGNKEEDEELPLVQVNTTRTILKNFMEPATGKLDDKGKTMPGAKKTNDLIQLNESKTK